MKVTLTPLPRKNPRIPVEAEVLVPANFLDIAEAKRLPVWVGNRERRVDELFDIAVEGLAETPEDIQLVLKGDASSLKRVGEGMSAGEILIEGAIGAHCGNSMKGGSIRIGGDADAWLGREMTGGSITCRGHASHYLASGYRGERFGMRGGRVEVFGNAGDYAAEHLAGGTVIIHGDAGDLPGVEMSGGTLVILGSCTRACGNMTGGTAFVYGTVHQMLPAFRRKGTEKAGDPPAEFTVFEGDIANRGKGTLFVRNYKYLL